MAHEELRTDDARQAERKPGMITVLTISTLLTAGAVLLAYTLFAAS